MKVIEKENSSEEIDVGQWKISAKYGILSSNEGESLVLEPRLSKLNYLLFLNLNSIVSRQYLIDNIWNETIVNEESLTRAIADLRKLISNHFDNSIEIETIRKRGYKLSLKTGPKLYALKLKINPIKLLVLSGLIFTILFFLVYFNIINFKIIA